MVEVLPIETLTLRHRSYLTHDGNMAVVIGPQRETDHITALAGRKGVRITHAAETHTHNDYVSGGLVAAASGGSGRQQVVLGVRRRLERGDGHVANAVHIPFSQPPGRSDEVPAGDVWVYCHIGYRAVVAASILGSAARHVNRIDHEFDNAGGAGLTIARPAL